MNPKLIRKALLLGSALLVAGWFGATQFLDSKGQPILVKIHNEIQADFHSVNHIGADDFLNLNSEQVVVFDVREPDEYAVSHLSNAVQIDPNISQEAFEQQFKNSLTGKTVVFYCSVGWRSSDLAQRVNRVLSEQGVTESYNLTGGLFQWHNEERPLMSKTGTTTNAIHPYDAFWGQAIDDQSAIQYSPTQ